MCSSLASHVEDELEILKIVAPSVAFIDSSMNVSQCSGTSFRLQAIYLFLFLFSNK